MLIRIWSSSFGWLLSFINIELEFQHKAWRSKEFLFHMQQTLESADVLKEKSKKEQNQRREEGKRDLRVMWEAAWRRAVVSILMWHQQNDSSPAQSVAACRRAGPGPAHLHSTWGRRRDSNSQPLLGLTQMQWPIKDGTQRRRSAEEERPALNHHPGKEPAASTVSHLPHTPLHQRRYPNVVAQG